MSREPLRVLALMHCLGFFGAQISTVEFFQALKGKLDLRVVACQNTNKDVLANIESLSIDLRVVPCYLKASLPEMNIEGIENWVKWADVVWITDIELLSAPRIKRVKNVPVVVHLHSYPLLCPWWGLLYGMREVCQRGCGLWRIARCKQLFNEELGRLGIISPAKALLYEALDLAKSPLDYLGWRAAVTREVLDSVDAFIAISGFVKRVHEELLPVEGKLIEVIYDLAIAR